jgi:hypothetical protein
MKAVYFQTEVVSPQNKMSTKMKEQVHERIDSNRFMEAKDATAVRLSNTTFESQQHRFSQL